MSNRPASHDRAPVAFRGTAGWAEVPVGLVEATGPDAVRFIDHFTTAAIEGLEEGSGVEGFFADARGWVLALATIMRTEAGLVVATDVSLAAGLRDHLERHHIRERLELRDVSAATDAVLVAGLGAREAAAAVCDGPLPAGPACHTRGRIGGLEARIVRVAGQGVDGYRIEVPAGRGSEVAAVLAAAGLPRGDLATLDDLRIEAAFPTPADIPPKTLPQELGRDSRAISFTKGCYLGQETVARLDALGHVNRRLTLLAIDAVTIPDVPVAVLQAGVPVGTLTSACLSPLIGPCGLGLVQCRALVEGALEVGSAPARPVQPAAVEQEA